MDTEKPATHPLQCRDGGGTAHQTVVSASWASMLQRVSRLIALDQVAFPLSGDGRVMNFITISRSTHTPETKEPEVSELDTRKARHPSAAMQIRRRDCPSDRGLFFLFLDLNVTGYVLA